jgi:hypothetical protein
MQAPRAEGQATLSAPWWLRDRAARLACKCCSDVSGPQALHRAAARARPQSVGGRPRGWRKDPRARTLRHVDDVIERLPPLSSRPVEQWSVRELLVEVVRLGLLRAYELLSRPVKDNLDPREHRRVEIGLRVAQLLLAHVQLAALEQTTEQQRMVEYEAAVERYERRRRASEGT